MLAGEVVTGHAHDAVSAVLPDTCPLILSNFLHAVAGREPHRHLTVVCPSASTAFTLLQEGDPLGTLLFDYLVHEGYWDTANRVAQDILLGRVQVSEQV